MGTKSGARGLRRGPALPIHRGDMNVVAARAEPDLDAFAHALSKTPRASSAAMMRSTTVACGPSSMSSHVRLRVEGFARREQLLRISRGSPSRRSGRVSRRCTRAASSSGGARSQIETASALICVRVRSSTKSTPRSPAHGAARSAGAKSPGARRREMPFRRSDRKFPLWCSPQPLRFRNRRPKRHAQLRSQAPADGTLPGPHHPDKRDCAFQTSHRLPDTRPGRLLPVGLAHWHHFPPHRRSSGSGGRV